MNMFADVCMGGVRLYYSYSLSSLSLVLASSFTRIKQNSIWTTITQVCSIIMKHKVAKFFLCGS